MKSLLIILSGFLPICLFAQNNVDELPIYFGQFFNDPQVLAVDFIENNSLQFSLGHRRNSNNFGGVNSSFFATRFTLQAKGNTGFHELGLTVANDTEGFLIRRNRAYLVYARHLRFNDNLFLAGGVNAGGYIFSLKSNSVTGGFQQGTFDGSFGVSIYNQNTRLGVSLNQIMNSSVQPIQQEIQLIRHLNLFASHQITISQDFALLPSMYSRYTKKSNLVYSGWYSAFCLRMLLKDIISAGLSYETGNGYYFFLGLEAFEMDESELSIGLSYFTPKASNIRTNLQLFEVSLKYQIKTNQ